MALFLVVLEDLMIWMTMALQSWHTVISIPFSLSAFPPLATPRPNVVDRNIRPLKQPNQPYKSNFSVDR